MQYSGGIRVRFQPEQPASPAPIVGGTAVYLGGPPADVQTMLAPDGRHPDLPNGMDIDTFGNAYIMRRVAELVALFDNPLYSFFSGVEMLTREKMRTTMFSGASAVDELFSNPRDETDRFFHRLPINVNDRKRKEAANGRIPEDGPMTTTFYAPAATSAVGVANFPIVGKVGMPLGSPVHPPSSTLQTPLSPPPISVLASNYVANPTAARVHLQSLSQIPVDNASLLPKTAVRDSTGYTVEVRPTEQNIAVKDAAGNVEYVHNVADGDVVATRRLLSGQPMSSADERVWSRIFDHGIGVTQPVPKQSSEQLEMRRMVQRSQIIDFARSISDPRELSWKLVPEHLRILFLTSEGATALEHAAWFAHFQQPWDENAIPTQHNTDILTDRQRVPIIDLITHEMVRVPFQSLVANIILYWRHRRAADQARTQEDLAAINGIINTLKTMRDDLNGFVSLLGHYDVESQQSRFDLSQKRAAEFVRTQTYHSDMDRTFYSKGQRAGRFVSAMAHNSRNAPFDVSIRSSIFSSSTNSNPYLASRSKSRWN